MGKRKGRKSDNLEIEDIERLKRELNRARSKGQFKEVSDLLNQIGVTSRILGQFDDALDYHDEEAQITKKYFPNDQVGLGVAKRAKAEVYLEMKQEEDALPLVREYLKLSRLAGSIVEEQRAHVTLGRVYLGLYLRYSEENEDLSTLDSKKKSLDKAEEEFQKARELANHKSMESKNLGPELMDMRCGVLRNIGVVYDLKGNLEGSQQFFLKAIEIAKSNKFYEHLNRAYVNLCDIYSKSGKFKEAKEAAEEAAKAGKCLEKLGMEIEARISIAKMFFMLDEITSGVRILKKLRKQVLAKEGDDEVSEFLSEIESLLKSGVRITRNEDQLHVTAKENYRQRQKLYEILADNYVEVGNYSEAVKLYQSSIENAEKAGFSNKELAKLYFSVALTYRDKGDENNALLFFQKEIEFHSNNPAEAFKTQTNITSSLEKLPHISPEEIIDAHEQALEYAKSANSPRKQIAALKNFESYLKSVKRFPQAEEVHTQTEQLKELYGLSDENEEPDSQNDLLDDEGQGHDDDVDLDHLTSEEESSDEDETGVNNTTVAVPKKKKFRVNEKGETALHKAAIKGDLKIVRRLIRQGHDVNARDMGGWVPLHEACNFGHLEVVEELLENGARVNERCGKVCGELTPLHDAANNGHFEVVRILLKYKASVTLKDGQGNYPLDLLFAWRERAKADGTVFSEENLSDYREVRTTLRNLMEKAGKTYERIDELRARRNGKRDAICDSSSVQLLESRKRGHDPIPVRVTVENYDPDDAGAAVDLYSTTIRGLRRTEKKNESSRKSSRRKRTADSDQDDDNGGTLQDDMEGQGLIPASQYVDDDWLVDGEDLPLPVKPSKRKRDPMEEIREIDSRNIRRRREGGQGQGRRNDVARLDIVPPEQRDDNSEELLDLDESHAQDQEDDFRIRSPSITLGFDHQRDDSNSNSNSGDLLDENSPSPSPSPVHGRTKSFSELMAENDDDSNKRDKGKETSKKKSKSTALIVLSSDEDEELEDSEEGLSLYHRLNHDDAAFVGSSGIPESSKTTKLTRKRSNRTIQTRLPFKIVQNSNSSPPEPGPSSNSNLRRKSSSIERIDSIPSRGPAETILRLKIRVNEKVFMVPVQESHFNATIDWLCEECSRRYFESYGVRPILSLCTKDGAILSGNDIIRVVLSGSETELIANIISFDLQRLPDRFKSAVEKIPDLKFDDEILLGLDECQSSNALTISDCNLRRKVGQCLFQSLQYQSSLRELILPDCSLLDEGVHHLSTILSTLPQLTTLDLSCNGITKLGIHELSEAFKKLTTESLPIPSPRISLTTLDLSFNPLGSTAGVPLTNLLSQLTLLKKIGLASCDLSLKVLTESRLNNALSKLRLEEMDISYNNGLRETGLDLLRRSLQNIKSLVTTSCLEDEDEENI